MDRGDEARKSDEAGRVEEDGGVPDRLKGKVSPEGWALYKRMTAMSQEEYLEMSDKYTHERMTQDILERIY